MPAPTPESVVCSPCPHKGICCKHGADVSDVEAALLKKTFGSYCLLKVGDSYRTAIFEGMCVFHRKGLCTIHGEAYYPSVCAGYPWTDGILGGPYQGDRQECPEFFVPETEEPDLDVGD